ncbi:MAG: cache domain-containing protein, partial [Candidatus Heimdallarchaeota archaeon]
FDPRHREFYVDAQLSGVRATNDPSLNPIAIGRPHLDPTGTGLVITVSYPIYLDNGTLIGVVGSDLSLKEMESEIKDLKLLETGYSFLIDKDKTPIVHKELTATTSLDSIIDLEYSNENDDGLSNFQLILEKMTLLEADQEEYTKNGEKWFISYYPVEIPQFSLAIVVAENQILAAANQIKDKANDAMVQQLFTFLFIIIVFGILMFYGVKRTSEKIVHPIRELTSVTDQIAKGDLNKSLSGEVGGSKEITLLYNTFRGLVTALRFGNEEYYAGNLRKAMTNYQNALELFTTMENTKGVGICYNNIANIQKARSRLKEANASYLKAIEIGETLLEASTSKQERLELIMSLSSRNNNVAMLYMEIEKYDIAEELLQKSLDYDLSIGNKKGYATRYGNLGLIYLAQDKIEMSRETFYKAYELATELDSKRTIAYAEMNLGIYHSKINENERAKEYLFSAAEHAEDLDTRVVIISLVNLKEIFVKEGATRLAAEIDHKLEVQKIGVKRPKNIIFVLDHSGSMMIGGRNRESIRGISKIFDTQIDEDDIVSFLIFNYKRQTIINQVKKSSLPDFQSWINTLNKPTGGTAMYDAIGDAFDIASNIDVERDVWVIVLTDGEDNRSKQYNHHKRIRLHQCGNPHK